MEMLSRLRWFIIGFIVLIFLLLVGWGLISIARNIFDGGISGSSSQTSDSAEDILIDTVDVARFSVSGPVVATNEHRSYTIEVNERLVVFTLYSDYGQKQLNRKSFTNNEAAYDEFIEALDKANVLSRRSGTDVEDDINYEGACPSGRRYIIELNDDVTRWSTSCESSRGTFGGSMKAIRRLFNKQVPEIRDLLDDTGLYVS